MAYGPYVQGNFVNTNNASNGDSYQQLQEVHVLLLYSLLPQY